MGLFPLKKVRSVIAKSSLPVVVLVPMCSFLKDIIRDGNTRQPEWSESIVEGSERFMQGVLHKLEIRAKGRKVREGDDRYELREPGAAYSTLFARKTGF
jgi:hypothetical protein